MRCLCRVIGGAGALLLLLGCEHLVSGHQGRQCPVERHEVKSRAGLLQVSCHMHKYVSDIHVASRCTAVPQHTGDPLMSSGFDHGDQTSNDRTRLRFVTNWPIDCTGQPAKLNTSKLCTGRTAEIPFSGRSARSGQGTPEETNPRTR
jgi:hypothetical protein